MKDERWPVVWQGQLVGWLERPFLDMFTGCGRFVPADPKLAAQFLDAVASSDYDLFASFNGLNGLVTGPLSEDGELAFNHWHGRRADQDSAR
jgi:hypothetical protein